MLTKVKGVRFNLSLMLLLALASTGLPRLYLDQSNALSDLPDLTDFFSKPLESSLIVLRGKLAPRGPSRVYDSMSSTTCSISWNSEKCG